MSSENFFGASLWRFSKTVEKWPDRGLVFECVTCFYCCIAKEAIKARVIDVKITWVSNYRYPVKKSSNRAPVAGHQRDRASIT